tara:strand:+ start:553 stop:753 length:201 start_codon:yes stop_codon:yes gene_type:complete
MSVSRKVEFRFFKDYFEGEVLEEKILGKDLFPDIEELHGFTYTKIKRDTDGITFGVRTEQVRELNN